MCVCVCVQMRLMGECRGSLDAVKRAEEELTEDEDDVSGLTNPNTMDAQGKGQLHTNTHTDVSFLHATHTSSCYKYPTDGLNSADCLPSRCDRALGADPGSVYEREAQA